MLTITNICIINVDLCSQLLGDASVVSGATSCQTPLESQVQKLGESEAIGIVHQCLKPMR